MNCDRLHCRHDGTQLHLISAHATTLKIAYSELTDHSVLTSSCTELGLIKTRRLSHEVPDNQKQQAHAQAVVSKCPLRRKILKVLVAGIHLET